MAGATLDSIDDAIFEALGPLVHSASNPNGVVTLLDHFAGQLASPEEVHQLAGNSVRALLVGLENEGVDLEMGAAMTNGNEQTVSRATFAVLISVADARQKVSPGLKSAPTDYLGAHGAYRLLTLVKARLTNLVIAKTFNDWPLRYLGAEPYLIARGKLYVLIARFAAWYNEVDAPLPIDPNERTFDELNSDYNRDGTVEPSSETPDPANPLQNPRVETDVDIPQV